jgi:ribosomal protein L27
MSEKSGSSQSADGGKRRPSFIQRARSSLFRAKKTGGSDVATLRGTSGSYFEGTAQVMRGSGSDFLGCGCFGGGKDKTLFLLIKGPFCFVFSKETSSSPKYAISLMGMTTDVKPPSRGQQTVLFESNLGDVEYTFVFSTAEFADIAERFAATVSQQAQAAQTKQVRERLGHNHLINNRASIFVAEKIALSKLDDQPDVPVSAADVMSSVPLNPVGY